MRKASEVVAELKNMKLAAAAKTVEDGVAETLTYTSFLIDASKLSWA